MGNAHSNDMLADLDDMRNDAGIGMFGDDLDMMSMGGGLGMGIGMDMDADMNMPSMQ